MARLNDYAAFVAVVEAKSLTLAADQLHCSVSAVSKQLARLEQSLGVRLIDRSTKSLAVTDLGEQFYTQCTEILASVRSAEQSLKEEDTALSGKLVLSLPEVLLRTGFPDLLQQFSAQHPGVRFDLQISNSVDDIISGQIDFAFRLGELEDNRLTAVRLGEARLVLCAAPLFLAQHGIPKSVEELLSSTQFLLPRFLNLAEQLKRQMPGSSRNTFALETCHTASSEAAIYSSVRAGLGMAVLLDFSVADDFKDGTLLHILPDYRFPKQDIHLIFHERKYMPAKMRLFKEFIKREFPLML
ncbi:MAG: LysR family transcriptional regulator [Kordiimonadaceae bacterium]|nr:LysR family transcriptional regulator [Kordiimonadaceae bacterium]